MTRKAGRDAAEARRARKAVEDFFFGMSVIRKPRSTAEVPARLQTRRERRD